MLWTFNYWNISAIYPKVLQAQFMFQLSCLSSKVWIITSIWETNLPTQRPIFGFDVFFYCSVGNLSCKQISVANTSRVSLLLCIFDVVLYSGAKNKRHKILHKIGKSAVALWKPWVEKMFIPHLKALNGSFNLKYHTSKIVRLLDF